MKKRLIYIIAAVVLVLGAAAAATVYYYNSNSYVASVAGEKITKTEYLFFLGVVKEQMLSEANVSSTDAGKFWTTNIEGKSAQEVAKDKALETAKEIKIQIIKAKENKIALDSSEISDINSKVDKMVSQLNGRDAANKEIQSKYGISLDDYIKIYKEYMLVNKYAQAEQKKIDISDDQAKKYYQTDNNRDKVDKVTVRHILFSILDKDQKPLPEDKQKEAQKKANDILAKVRAGGDMKALANQYSEDPGVKENGGEYTFSINDSYVQEFKDWAFKAKVGETGIIKSDYGYHVMKLEKRTAFNDVKDAVKESVRNDEYNKKLEEWKKDSKYNVVKNQKVLDSIKVA